MTYQVTAKRWELGWELHVDGVGVTQSASLATAGKIAREYIAAMLDMPEDAEDTISVEITPELGPVVVAEVEEAREATRRAEEARDEAAKRTRAVISDLRGSGLSQSDVAVVLGLSTQRISQLVKS